LAAGWFWLTRSAGAEEAVRWLALAGAGTAYVFGALWRFLPEHRVKDGGLLSRLGPGNLLTVARGTLVAWLFGLLGTRMSSEVLGWLPAGLYLAVVVLDHVDGRLARASRTATHLGERLDLEYDGFSAFTAYALAVHFGRLPAVFLGIGLLRYAFQLGEWALPRFSRSPLSLPVSRGRRAIASLQSGFLVGLLWPIVGPPVATVAACLMGAALLGSFGRDALIVSGAIDRASYWRFSSRARWFLLGALPIALRWALAAMVGFDLFLATGIGGLGSNGEILKAATLLAIPALVVGAAAPSAAAVILVADIWAMGAAGPSLLGLVIEAVAFLVAGLGSGGWSVWKPENRLFDREGNP
jgi:phosphatidylglycerophosphate synthase